MASDNDGEGRGLVEGRHGVSLAENSGIVAVMCVCVRVACDCGCLLSFFFVFV